LRDAAGTHFLSGVVCPGTWWLPRLLDAREAVSVVYARNPDRARVRTYRDLPSSFVLVAC
jgi:hypothetical protein